MDGELPFILESHISEEPCSACQHRESSLLLTTFTVITPVGMSLLGRFAYCVNCEDIPTMESAHG
jgi:hypothetical protein